MAIEGLLLDFGSVVLRSAFELRGRAEAHLGLSPGSLDWAGPLAPETDPLWRSFQAGALTEREYWAERARLVGESVGMPDMTVIELFRSFYDPPGDDLVYPEAVATIRDACKAGTRVAVLTNDLEAFHGSAWIDAMTVLRLPDAIVDGSTTGILKPDPRAYRAGCAALGLPFESVLFVDDQPANIAGAKAVGLHVHHFDVTSPAASWAFVRRCVDGVAALPGELS